MSSRKRGPNSAPGIIVAFGRNVLICSNLSYLNCFEKNRSSIAKVKLPSVSIDPRGRWKVAFSNGNMALRYQRERDEANSECDEMRELELRQLRSAATDPPCEGRTAPEWYSYSVRPRTAFLLEPRGARTRPPRLRVVLVLAPCPCPGVLLLVCYSYLACALLGPTRARATLCLLLLDRYSFATRPLLVRYS